MNILDEYRKNARECQRMADGAGNASDKASWLRLAASWLGMIKNEPRQEGPEATEGMADARWPGASEKDSKASH
jgi:hypothetical protein